MKHSATTTRRLNDGAEALAQPAEAKTLKELIIYKDQLHDGIAALQSLDDLGSESANKAAWDDMLALQLRYDIVIQQIKVIKQIEALR